MKKIKDILVNLLLAAVSLVAGILLVEGALRVLPGSVTGVSEWLHLVADPDVAFLKKGNQSVTIEALCFSAPVSTNSRGFRDTEWDTPQTIAVLGDSFTEGAQVADGMDMSSRLESLTGLAVMNLGQASYGTVAELAAYEKFGRPYDPEIVILMFYANDILENDCEGHRGPNGTVTKPCGEIVDGNVVFNTNFYSTSDTHTLRSFLRDHCLLCRLLRELPQRLVASVSPPDQTREKPSYEVGLAVAKEALMRLRDRVREDGARLVVAIIPEYETVRDTTLTYKETVMRELLAELSIPTVPLSEAFMAYHAQYSLPEPHFSYSCDDHWNPVGHELAAHEVASFLAEGGYIASETPPPVPGPRALLGEQGYRAVYQDGIYRP